MTLVFLIMIKFDCFARYTFIKVYDIHVIAQNVKYIDENTYVYIHIYNALIRIYDDFKT